MASTVKDIKDFTYAVGRDWLARMSGPLSVPAAILALWLSNDIAKIILGLTAFTCLLVTAYRVWKTEHDKVVERNEKKRQLLDDISALREKVGDYRIAMEADHHSKRFNDEAFEAWKQKYTVLETEIASKIEQLSSKAEARTYLHRGNLQRAFRPSSPSAFLWPVLIDISIRDLDYLQAFIHAYSRRD
jgi:hypothetical protein